MTRLPQNPLNMHFDDLFHSPAGQMAAFSQMQVHLYRHDVTLQDYFLPLHTDTVASPRARSSDQQASNRLVKLAIRGADSVVRHHPQRKLKADVLVCPMPYFSRKTEIQFLIRTLLGLAQTDATILCLLPADAPCRNELDTQLAALGRRGQVTFIDPFAVLKPMEANLRMRLARMRGHSAFEETVRVLEPHGLGIGPEVEGAFEHTAYFVEAWERLAPWIEFDVAVARCHWHALCSPVCRTALQRGKRVITFQQGVIGHSLDLPVTASTYVAFGQQSASFLARANSRFFEVAGMVEAPVKYVSGGSLFDTITRLPNQFDHQTLLLVDLPATPGDFYGIERHCQALLLLAERLLTEDVPLRRLIIRPHPHWSNLDLEACQRLIREHATRCELSHPVWSLDDDLRRSSCVAGIFSGVLTVASACGLPTIFLQTEQGYMSGDLACFSPAQTLLPDEAFSQIANLLTDREAYGKARTQAFENAREYYANGSNLDCSAAFFEHLLRAESPALRAESADLCAF